MKYDQWDQETLQNVKTAVKRMFKRHYNVRHFEDDDMKARRGFGQLFSLNLRNMLRPPAGQHLLPWFKRRMLMKTSPFNKDGELCD